MLLLLLALLILTVPFPWLAASGVAACVHELGHIASVLFCGGKVQRADFGMNGIRIETFGLQCSQSIFCITAGPIMSLSLVLFLHRFPRLALCGLFQGCYNLLPFYPLDGGRILRQLLSERICQRIEMVCVVLLGAVSSYLICEYRISATAILCFLAFLALRIKIPCKERKGIVQ